MDRHALPTAGDAGLRLPVRQTDNRRLQASTRKSDVLTVKTPLLPRRSGITMESAHSYGASMEKRPLTSDPDTQEHFLPSRHQRSSRSSVKWVAAVGVTVLGALSVGIYSNASAYKTAKDVVSSITPSIDALHNLYTYTVDIENRQSSGNDNSTNPKDLAAFQYTPLPLGSIKPMGWLNDQMASLRDGLAGHEMEFYPIVQDSRWTGGATDYSDLNEGLPYWFNGLVPLAYGLGDANLMSQVENALTAVLKLQNQTTGWLGPGHGSSNTYDNSDLWGRYPFMLGMTQIAEANPTFRPQVIASLYKFLPEWYRVANANVVPEEIWGKARYQDGVLTLQWLYDNTPSYNGTDMRPLLLETMYTLKNLGADWVGYFQPQSFYFQDLDDIVPSLDDVRTPEYFRYLHGVNAGQGLKTPAVDYRFTYNQSLINVQRDGIDWSLQYHGNPMGSIIGDERESGLAPNRGSELCTAVETMFSMSYAYAVTGINAIADNAERIAFNAFPGMMTPDNWAHQYISMPNQPWGAPVDGGQPYFWNVGNEGLTFGLAPNYPCCAVNHPQGYPKFLSHSWMTSGNDGLAHVLLSPSTVATTLANGANVNISTSTGYPFSDILTYTINTDKQFTFLIRKPDWAASPAANVNGKPQTLTMANDFASITVSPGQYTIQYVLESSINVVNRANDTVSVYHGALLYALDVGYTYTLSGANSDITRVQPPTSNPAVQVALAYKQGQNFDAASTPANARTWNISNTQAWNFAVDPKSMKYFSSNSSSSSGVAVNTFATSGYGSETTSDNGDPQLPNPIWDYEAPAAYMKAVGCLVDWEIYGDRPFRPPLASNRSCVGKPVDLVFRPFGSLKVRMAELPTKDLGAPSLGGNSTSKI